MRHFAPTLFCLLLATGLRADVQLPTLFGDHMVLQADQPVHVWGSAEPGEEVSISFRNRNLKIATSESGNWSAYLPPSRAGGPFTLAVQGNNRVTIRDVFVGEVWIASGQSNMVWPLSRSDDAEAEIAAARHPGIRYFKVDLETADEPQDDVSGEWQVVSPDTAAEFSGVGYFFARHLNGTLEVPVGIIQSAWGGTPAEAWTSRASLSEDPLLAELITAYDRAATAPESRQREPRPQHEPTALFNAMIAPLTSYSIRGAIWYQGENNGNRGQGVLYRRLFRTMIEDWRHAWALGNFPFLFVQLANYGKVPATATWPELREAQSMALGLAHTGMAVTIDIGNPTDIHPRNKQDVGRRLALAARAVAYGENDLDHSGPIFRQATWEGPQVRLWFDHTAAGLEARDGSLRGFEVAGPTGEFRVATARIDGGTVVLSHPEVSAPSRARYGWAAAPDVNLFNSAGLPASPFRTMK